MTSMEMETDEVDNFDKNLSLYIPNIEENITLQKLMTLFQEEKIGMIERVDFVYNIKGVRQAFIHFMCWFDSKENREFQAKIINNKENAIIKGKKLSKTSKNLILLPNRNPRPSTEKNDLIQSLQERLNNLELLFKQMNNNQSSSTSNKRVRLEEE